MINNSADGLKRAAGQSQRLGKQHKLAGGPLGIFGDEAKAHDRSIRAIMEDLTVVLKHQYAGLVFRHRYRIPKKKIHDRLTSCDARLGKVLFVQKAAIKPDGGVLEVQDRFGNYRVILVSESKHQGNDVQKIRAGIKQGRGRDQDLMVAGNAVERVHKNIQEVKNMMLDKAHFPYVVFLQGSNFATATSHVAAPDGRWVKHAFIKAMTDEDLIIGYTTLYSMTSHSIHAERAQKFVAGELSIRTREDDKAGAPC